MKKTIKIFSILLTYFVSLIVLYLISMPFIYIGSTIILILNDNKNLFYLIIGILIVLLPIILLTFFTFKELKKSILDFLNEELEVDNENVEFYIVNENQLKDIYDKKLLNYIKDIKRKLNYQKEVLIIRARNSNIVNAFAISNLSGEAIVVYDGILKNFTEGEIKAILGHEFGHLKNRDSLYKIMIYSMNYVYPYIDRLNYTVINFLKNIPYINLLALIFVINDSLIKVLNRFLVVPLITVILQFSSRQAEFLADEIGARVTMPKYMINALKRISENEQKNDNLLMKILSTHPPTQKRIEYLKNLKG